MSEAVSVSTIDETKVKGLFLKYIGLTEEKDIEDFSVSVSRLATTIDTLSECFVEIPEGCFKLVSAPVVDDDEEDPDFSDVVRNMMGEVVTYSHDEILELSERIDGYIKLKKREENLGVTIGGDYEFGGRKLGKILDIPTNQILILQKYNKEGQLTKKRIKFTVPKIVEIEDDEE